MLLQATQTAQSWRCSHLYSDLPLGKQRRVLSLKEINFLIKSLYVTLQNTIVALFGQ